MKKVLFVILSLLFTLPVHVQAVEIVSTSLTGDTSGEVGGEVKVNFKIDFDGLINNDENRTGIELIVYEIKFDDNVFVLSNAIAKDFTTIYDNENGIYYVASTVIPDASSNNCVAGILYCGNYSSTLEFYIKNTQVKESIIEIGEVSVGLLNIEDFNKTYTYEDLTTIDIKANKNITVNITNNTQQEVEEPKNNTTNTNITDIKENIEVTPSKSKNAFLKSLEIEGYEIDFDKNTSEYTITTDENTTSLDIKVTPEDSKATYKINGAKNFRKNNNKVTIEVYSESDTIKTYTINVIVKNDETNNEVKENITEEKTDETNKKSNDYLNNKLFKYSIIVIGVIVLIIILTVLNRIRKKRAIDKYFKDN